MEKGGPVCLRLGQRGIDKLRHIIVLNNEKNKKRWTILYKYTNIDICCLEQNVFDPVPASGGEAGGAQRV